MVELLAPRRESEFVDELRDWFLRADPAGSFFSKGHSLTGGPDLHFARRMKTGVLSEFMAEAKFLPRQPRSLESVWNQLRKNQQLVIPRMANASKIPFFLVTCINGHEALWHRFNKDQMRRHLKGEIPPWNILALQYISKRTKLGKWVMMSDQSPEQ